MHQKHPPAKTALLVEAGGLCAGARSTISARQAAANEMIFMLSTILDTGGRPLFGKLHFVLPAAGHPAISETFQTAGDSSMAKTFGMLFGIVFLAVGILGFVPGVTKDEMLLGIFHVNTVHSVVHIVSGA